MVVTPNQANIPGVPAIYRLGSIDHPKAISSSILYEYTIAINAKQPGRKSIMNVFRAGLQFITSVYGLKMISMHHNRMEPIPDNPAKK